MPPTVTPANAQSTIDSAQPGSTVYLGSGNYPRLNVYKPLRLSAALGVDPASVKIAGANLRGGGISLAHLRVDCGGTGTGIFAVDGLAESSCDDIRIENCDTAIEVSHGGGERTPNVDLTFRNIRARNCRSLGIILGQAARVRFGDVWMHKCGVMGNNSTHAYYWNDDNVSACDAENVWATDSATGFRGSLTKNKNLLVSGCAGGIASGKNCGSIIRPIVMDHLTTSTGALQIRAIGPCVIEQPMLFGSDQVSSKGLELSSPSADPTWLHIKGGVFYGFPANPSKGMSVNINSKQGDHYIEDLLIASNVDAVPGRQNIWYQAGVDPARTHLYRVRETTTAAAGLLDPTRTLERYDREVLGGPGTKDHLWGSPCTMSAVHAWIAAGVGL